MDLIIAQCHFFDVLSICFFFHGEVIYPLFYHVFPISIHSSRFPAAALDRPACAGSAAMGTAQVLCARPCSGCVGVGGRCWGCGAGGDQGDGGDAGHAVDGSEGSKDPGG